MGKYEFLSLEGATVPTLTLHTLKTTAKQDRYQRCHPSTHPRDTSETSLSCKSLINILGIA